MYKKIVKIVRRGMIIYILCLVFPDELKVIVKSIGLILEGAVCWIGELLWEKSKGAVEHWWEESVIEGLKSLIPFGGGK